MVLGIGIAGADGKPGTLQVPRYTPCDTKEDKGPNRPNISVSGDNDTQQPVLTAKGGMDDPHQVASIRVRQRGPPGSGLKQDERAEEKYKGKKGMYGNTTHNGPIDPMVGYTRQGKKHQIPTSYRDCQWKKPDALEAQKRRTRRAVHKKARKAHNRKARK
jgi:hypothetical protein